MLLTKSKILLKKLPLVAGAVVGLYIVLLILEAFIFSGRLGLSTRIAGVNVSGMTQPQAITALDKRWNEYKNSDVTINDQTVKPDTLVSNFDAKKSVETALQQQTKGYLVLLPFRPKTYSAELTLNSDNVDKILSDQTEKVSNLAEDAKLTLTPETKITPEKNGQKLLATESRVSIQSGLMYFEPVLKLRTEEIEPLVKARDLEALTDKVKEATNVDIIAHSNYGDFTIKKEDLQSWVLVSATMTNGAKSYQYFDKTKVSSWADSITTKIGKPAINARLGAVNGKVTVITASQVGHELDKTDLSENIQTAAIGDKGLTLTVKDNQPEITEAKISELGISELISTGSSNFAGSPNNRKVNISVGASKFNGVIIKPGEDFSFVKTLGAVDASTGYLPELVIKKDKTVPEYGGGLCQVSSTAFRAALNAGLPITERHAHAYPVSYYTPYGVDATIYLPWPDLRFTNDTGKYILIQTRTEGTRLYFDFYGTKVARTVKFSGNKDAIGVVDAIEKVSPSITDAGARGRASFTAVFFRHIYDSTGALIANNQFISKYDSPDKYPH